MKSEEKIINDINKFGYHIINVFEGENNYQFSYTIGLFGKLQKPEIIISGLNDKVRIDLIYMYVENLKNGFYPVYEQENVDFIEGFSCYLKLIDRQYYNKYLGKAYWYYGNYDFKVLQLVWPNEKNQFPWETDQDFTQDLFFIK